MSTTKKNAARKTTRKPAVAAAPAAEPLMYVGPTIRGVAIQNRVYTEIPEPAKAAITECPLLVNLFVQIQKYPIAERQISEGRGSLYVAFDAALSYKEKHN